MAACLTWVWEAMSEHLGLPMTRLVDAVLPRNSETAAERVQQVVRATSRLPVQVVAGVIARAHKQSVFSAVGSVRASASSAAMLIESVSILTAGIPSRRSSSEASEAAVTAGNADGAGASPALHLVASDVDAAALDAAIGLLFAEVPGFDGAQQHWRRNPSAELLCFGCGDIGCSLLFSILCSVRPGLSDKLVHVRLPTSLADAPRITFADFSEVRVARALALCERLTKAGCHTENIAIRCVRDTTHAERLASSLADADSVGSVVVNAMVGEAYGDIPLSRTGAFPPHCVAWDLSCADSPAFLREAARRGATCVEGWDFAFLRLAFAMQDIHRFELAAGDLSRLLRVARATRASRCDSVSYKDDSGICAS